MANKCSGCCQPKSALLSMVTNLCLSWTTVTPFSQAALSQERKHTDVCFLGSRPSSNTSSKCLQLPQTSVGLLASSRKSSAHMAPVHRCPAQQLGEQLWARRCEELALHVPLSVQRRARMLRNKRSRSFMQPTAQKPPKGEDWSPQTQESPVGQAAFPITSALNTNRADFQTHVHEACESSCRTYDSLTKS